MVYLEKYTDLDVLTRVKVFVHIDAVSDANAGVMAIALQTFPPKDKIIHTNSGKCGSLFRGLGYLAHYH